MKSPAARLEPPRDPDVTRSLSGLDEEAASRGVRLFTRLFLGSGLLVAATVGLAVMLFGSKAEEFAERRLRRDVDLMPEIVSRYEDSQALALRDVLRAGAAERLKGRFATGSSPEALREAAVDLSSVLGARAVSILDAEGRILAASDDRLDTPPATPAASEGAAFQLVFDPVPALSLVVSTAIPLAGPPPRTLVVRAAFPVDERHASALAHLVSGEVAFLANTARPERKPA